MDGACAHFEKNPSVPLPTTHLEIWEGDKMDERGGVGGLGVGLGGLGDSPPPPPSAGDLQTFDQ